jgi:adenylate cyclase
MTLTPSKTDSPPEKTGSAAPDGEPWFCAHSLERSARLWSGLILMAFVTTHLINHAVGIFGVNAISELQNMRVAIWRSWPGSILLYGALAVHVLLALRRALGRRTWRMPLMEAFQIVLGILIPLLLLDHVIGTRALSSAAGTDDSYVNVLRYLWPSHALMQAVALMVVWVHGIIGLYYYFRLRSWFKSLSVPFFVTAAAIPMLALAGFVSAGREALTMPATNENWTAAQGSMHAMLQYTAWTSLAAVAAACMAFVVFRFVKARLSPSVTVSYTGHGDTRAPSGLTLLEMSRLNGIPHPSSCGGRGRCSSCRVLVLSGDEKADPPSMLEKRMLDRIRAPRQVRLACQYKPKGDVAIRVLLSARNSSMQGMTAADSLEWGTEEELSVLFADIRGFSTIARNQIPADVFVLLNRVLSELTHATEARGGRVVMTQTDGIMAVFGLGATAKVGSRAALNAAADMLKAVHMVNKEMLGALPLPVRVGIGIHTGSVIVSRVGDADSDGIVAIGETVSIASRLEEATKESVADCLVSAATLTAAAFSAPALAPRLFHYKHGDQPIAAHAFGDRQDLRRLLGRAEHSMEAGPGPGAGQPQTAA